jgi:hypothetical protein
MGVMKNVYKILIGNLEEKRPLERPGRRWEDNIKIDPKEMVLRVLMDSSGSG